MSAHAAEQEIARMTDKPEVKFMEDGEEVAGPYYGVIPGPKWGEGTFDTLIGAVFHIARTGGAA